MRTAKTLPEVTLLRDARGPRPENAAGVGEFWYETGIWTLPLSPQAKVLYASLCSHLKHGEVNRKDLRAALKDSSDAEISAPLSAARLNLPGKTAITSTCALISDRAASSFACFEGATMESSVVCSIL